MSPPGIADLQSAISNPLLPRGLPLIQVLQVGNPLPTAPARDPDLLQ